MGDSSTWRIAQLQHRLGNRHGQQHGGERQSPWEKAPRRGHHPQWAIRLRGEFCGAPSVPAPFGAVSVIATASNTVVATIPVGVAPLGAAISPPGRFFYVTNSEILQRLGDRHGQQHGGQDNPHHRVESSRWRGHRPQWVLRLRDGYGERHRLGDRQGRQHGGANDHRAVSPIGVAATGDGIRLRGESWLQQRLGRRQGQPAGARPATQLHRCGHDPVAGPPPCPWSSRGTTAGP